ncbi:glucose 1-dehydrogenase [Brasilonema sp. UFV-L1]|uniref:glucose 1-dehydrogenase n=1 Tax=Brasilonema sp. UFV-L1 TaxID=2234130 RepID=UPI00145E5973|nr:glucose 1-dehydrogenase [Brasilonema sp. UFV-L1]NMG05834.1 oxidoreductase [Brasilonema sp. UFV-L1]
MNFQGKVALVTGGSSGIGRAAAIAFAKAGANVVVAARRESDEVVRLIKNAGGEATFVQTDVSKSDEIANLIKTTVKTYGRLDYAFNNAGTEGKFAPITQLTEADWEHTMTVNLKGVWLCMKYEIEQLLKQGSGGAIVNTSSWLAKGGLMGSTIYSASKGGLDGMVRPAALEYASQGIRINNINPGIIDTEMSRRFFHPEDEGAKPFINHIPAKRFGTSEEVAEVVVWLCSDAASYITGQTISVDAGYAIPGHR